MTGSIASSVSGFLRGAVGTVQVVVCLAIGWFAVSAGLMLVSGAAPAALVVLPDQAFFDELPDDIRILQWRRRSAVVTSSNPDYVRRLYKAGALLVLPARKQSCLDLRTRENILRAFSDPS